MSFPVSSSPDKPRFWVGILALLTAPRTLLVTPSVLLRRKKDKYPAGIILATAAAGEIAATGPAVEYMAQFEAQFQGFLQETPEAKLGRMNACTPGLTDGHCNRGDA